MKSTTKSLVILATLFLLSTTVFARKILENPEIYFGLNGGMNASRLNFSPIVNQTFLTGYAGGLTFRYIGEKSLGVQAELNYVQRGWNEGGLYARQLEYIELPFLTHFNFGDKFRFFVNIGPQISYLIAEKTLVDNTESSTEIQHITGAENAFDYGFCTGLGFLINIKGSVFQLETRANYSMSDVFSNAKKDYFDTSNNMNAAVIFTWLIQKK